MATNQGQMGLLPVPDPTTLTTEQLRREITALREILETRFAGLEKVLALAQAHLDTQHAAIITGVSSTERLIDAKLNAQREVANERFSAIEMQFQAQKEAAVAQNDSNAIAIGKSEAAFSKQLDQHGVLLQTMEQSVIDKITDIRSRLDRGEGTEGRQARADQRGSVTVGLVISAIIASTVVLTSLVSLISFLVNRH